MKRKGYEVKEYKSTAKSRKRAKRAGKAEEKAAQPYIVEAEKLNVKSMAVEEAVAQMEEMGHNFLVFLNRETQKINVVFKRRDGNYGLVIPEF